MYFKLLKYCDCLSVIHYYCNLLFAAYFKLLQIISEPLQQGSKLQCTYNDSFQRSVTPVAERLAVELLLTIF